MTTTNDATRTTRVEEIIWCLGQADQIEKDAEHEASSLRWRAAREICAELETKTQREVADEIHKDQSFVARAAQTHRLFGEGGLMSDELAHQERSWESFDSYYKRIEKNGPRMFSDLSRQMSSDGVSNRAIAARLGIDEKTVRGYLRGYLQEEGEQYDYQAKYREEAAADGDENSAPCEVLNPFPGTFKSFKEEASLLLKTRQLREDRASFDAVRRAITRYGNALDKIERDFYQ